MYLGIQKLVTGSLILITYTFQTYFLLPQLPRSPNEWIFVEAQIPDRNLQFFKKHIVTTYDI